MIEELEKLKQESKVCDIEADGLLDTITKLHVMSTSYFKGDKFGIYSHSQKDLAKQIIENTDDKIVGHNFFLYDIPALEKLLNVKLPLEHIVDTLFISWYIEPERVKHGLASYGEDFGIPKPEIEDWVGLSLAEYKNRCEEDVKINTALWHDQLNKLHELYSGDMDMVNAIIGFLMTKGRVYKMHLDNPLRLDIKGVKESLETLRLKEAEILIELSNVMPKDKVKAKKSRPKNMYKKDGSLSAHGEKWVDLIESQGFKLGQEPDEIEYIRGEKDPNPGSPTQIKDWFFSLGWKPETFKETTLSDGSPNKVPQVKKGEDLCPSVIKLAEKEPAILAYKDLGVIQHRIGLLEGKNGFLNRVDDEGNIVADIGGLTNTLRIKHRGLVNMPSPSQLYGEHIRKHLLPPKGHVMIGCDLSGLESTTRNNFVIDIDPKFVEEQSHPLYDPHLDIAVESGMITEQDSAFYKVYKAARKDSNNWYADYGELSAMAVESQTSAEEHADLTAEEWFDNLDHFRQSAKTTNYSAMYGVGKNKLSKELGTTVAEAKGLIDAYWAKNWSVSKFAKGCAIKDIMGQMWVKNPLNKFWYSLRYEKDIFSTVNQGAGDYIFTLWEYYLMELGVIIHGGFHDEIITSCPEEDVDKVVNKLYEAIEKVNRVLRLKVPVSIDYKIGSNYGEVH